jgi:hypothetical protein
VQLSSGWVMPTVGFGTAGLGVGTAAAVEYAAAAGYRMFDSAEVSTKPMFERMPRPCPALPCCAKLMPCPAVFVPASLCHIPTLPCCAALYCNLTLPCPRPCHAVPRCALPLPLPAVQGLVR